MKVAKKTEILTEASNVETKQVDLSITGMTCSSCVNSIEKSLNKLSGVRATVNLAMETAHIIAPVKMNEAELISAVKASGYEAKAFKGERESFEKSRKLGLRLLLTAFLTIPIFLLMIIDATSKSFKESNRHKFLILC
jgi:P-type Cu+ transporter